MKYNNYCNDFTDSDIIVEEFPYQEGYCKIHTISSQKIREWNYPAKYNLRKLLK